MNGNNIIEKIKSGDDAILRQIYRDYKGPFCGLLQKNYGIKPDLCIELFQIAVVILYDNIATGRLTELTVDLQTYLIGIGKIKAKEHLRKKNQKVISWDEKLTHTILDLDEVEDKKLFEQKFTQVIESLNQLGKSCQHLISLFYFQEMKLGEINQELNYKNTSTTKNLKYKCLQKLRRIYQEMNRLNQIT